MATYVLPDNRLTDEQRDSYYLSRVPEDAYEFMAYIQDQFPAVYDDAVLNTGRTYRLRDMKTKRAQEPDTKTTAGAGA